jgi:hypothetical protein
MTEWASEHEFPLPDGSGKWIVRAYEFPTAATAAAEWERIQGQWRGRPGEGNFSLWRTMLADESTHLVVICARPEHLVEVGGEPFDMPYNEAAQFALRRARVGKDAFDEGQEHVTQENRYGEDTPVRIDDEGYVKRWYRT